MRTEGRCGFGWTLCALLGLLSASPAPGRDPLLPVHLGAWERAGWRQAEAPQLERLVGEQAPLYREYGSLRAEQADYRRGAAEWRVTLQVMRDRSGAYGAFTLLRAGGEPVALGEAGARAGDAYLFYQGNYFLSAQGPAELPDLQRLSRLLGEQSGPTASLPTLPSYLPRRGLMAGSDRYLLGPLALARVAPLAPGDWAGFAYGAEVEAASYRVDTREAILLMISYPTPQIAAARLRDFERLLNLNGTGDPLRPLAYAKRSGTLVALVAGIESGQDAASVLSQVRYEAELSWSETSDPSAEVSWTNTLQNLFLGTAVFVLFAFLSGLLFGAIRLLVKRCLPGKVFDRPEDTEIIVLNLNRGK